MGAAPVAEQDDRQGAFDRSRRLKILGTEDGKSRKGVVFDDDGLVWTIPTVLHTRGLDGTGSGRELNNGQHSRQDNRGYSFSHT